MMPQIDFAEPFAEKTSASAGKSNFSIFAETEIASPVYVEPARFPRGQIGRSEWINLSFAAIMLLGGVFSAFYLFNGAELFRDTLALPRELLYARPLRWAAQGATVSGAVANERPRGVPAPKTDPTGDPFPRVGGPLTLDRLPYTSPRESGGLPGTTSPTIPSSPIPGVPGSPGAPGGGLPGPGALVSKLSLLVPGADALTQSLRTAAANLEKNITVTIRHDILRVVNVRRLVRHVQVVTRALSIAGRGRGLGQRVSHNNQNVRGRRTITLVSSGISSTRGTPVNGGGAGTVSIGSGKTSSGIGSTVGVTGALGSVVGGFSGLTGGGHGGIGGRAGRGGGGHR